MKMTEELLSLSTWLVFVFLSLCLWKIYGVVIEMLVRKRFNFKELINRSFGTPVISLSKFLFKFSLFPVSSIKYNFIIFIEVVAIILSISTIPFLPSLTIRGVETHFLLIKTDYSLLFLLLGCFVMFFVDGLKTYIKTGMKYRLVSNRYLLDFIIVTGVFLCAVIPVFVFTKSLDFNSIYTSTILLKGKQVTVNSLVLILPISFLLMVFVSLYYLKISPFVSINSSGFRLVSNEESDTEAQESSSFIDGFKVVSMSIIIVYVFLGGFRVPFVTSMSGFQEHIQILVIIFSVYFKISIVLLLFLLFKYSFPKMSFESIMDLIVNRIFPVGLINILFAVFLVRFFGGIN